MGIGPGLRKQNVLAFILLLLLSLQSPVRATRAQRWPCGGAVGVLDPPSGQVPSPPRSAAERLAAVRGLWPPPRTLTVAAGLPLPRAPTCGIHRIPCPIVDPSLSLTCLLPHHRPPRCPQAAIQMFQWTEQRNAKCLVTGACPAPIGRARTSVSVAIPNPFGRKVQPKAGHHNVCHG